MNVYHYTSLDAVRGILRDKDICFWGTRYDSLNDPTDCAYAEEDILPEFKEFLKEETWPVHLNDEGKKRLGRLLVSKLKEIEPLD